MNAAMDPLLGHRQENNSNTHGDHHYTTQHVYQADAAARGDLMAVVINPNGSAPPPAKSKRLCKFPDCTRVIKSQNLCQKHGAKTKRCRVDGCEKQAQGTHDGMCKRHWKSINCPEEASSDQQPPPAEGDSVYDTILPASIAFRPGNSRSRPVMQMQSHVDADLIEAPTAWAGNNHATNENSGSSSKQPDDPPRPPPGTCVMPLITFLQHERHREPGWHRNAERRARGMFLVSNLSQQLEPWERQLALVEILLLSGGTPYANFKDLAHAWGREKGFHTTLVGSICERRGEVERKKRSDIGKTLNDEQKASFRKKLRQKRGLEDDAANMDESFLGAVQFSMGGDMEPNHHHGQHHGHMGFGQSSDSVPL